jgi:basic amino acid/polyamine antiporter, APA family
MGRFTTRKSVEERRAHDHGMHRLLGWPQLIVLGVGCIVGAGVYIMTGLAAANYAGPAVILSFLIAGFGCGLTALCYAELASTLPVAGSSYTYCYASMGEVYAWILGWMLMLEYGLAASALAVGFSSYLTSILADLGLHLPLWVTTSTIVASVVQGNTHLSLVPGANLFAVAALLAAAAVLVAGVSKSTLVTSIFVVIKVGILLAFVVVGASYVKPQNWAPFIPENTGGFSYGWPGVLRGASILFFAYLGFETVSTAAAETRNPQRDIPIGILGALFISALLYIAVAAVMTGLVPYRELALANPIAVAVDHMHLPGFALVIKIGALTGLASVLLVNGYGHSRICFAMGQDGLLPPLFAKLHPLWKTPALGTITVCLISALVAATLPISVLGDLVSLGTGLAFCIVAISLMWLRSSRPDLERPFKVPLGGVQIGRVWLGVVPVLAIVMCLIMVMPVLLDLIVQAWRGNGLPLMCLAGYALIGIFLYGIYGHRNVARRAL